jgi:HEAT repeat protein
MNAAAALGPIGDRRATPALLNALKREGTPDAHTRAMAARSLGQIADPAAVDGLIAALNDPAAAGDAAWALGQLADPKAIDPLAALLFGTDDARYRARTAAAEALGRIRHPGTVARLVEGLLSAKPPSEAINEARRALGEMLGSRIADDPGRLAEWWKEHAEEYKTGEEEGKK